MLVGGTIILLCKLCNYDVTSSFQFEQKFEILQQRMMHQLLGSFQFYKFKQKYKFSVV